MPKPSELPVQVSDIVRARAWLQAKGHKNVLPRSKVRTQKNILAEVLILHGKRLDEVGGNDIS